MFRFMNFVKMKQVDIYLKFRNVNKYHTQSHSIRNLCIAEKIRNFASKFLKYTIYNQ